MTASKALSALDMGTNKIGNVGAPAAASTDAARQVEVDSALAAAKSYTDSALAGLASGQVLKGAVRAYSSTNVTVSSPGTTIDGLTPANGQIFLLGGQTTGTEGGPWTYNGSSSPMTRALNWDTNAEAVLGSYWVVDEGSKADSFALLTNDTTITLGTSTPAFKIIGVAAAVAATGFAANIPAIAAGATATLAHNLNTTDVIIQVKRTASPFDVVSVNVATPDANSVSVSPDVAVAAGDYRIVVKAVLP